MGSAEILFAASIFIPPIVLLLSAVALLTPTRTARERTYENRVRTVPN